MKFDQHLLTEKLKNYIKYYGEQFKVALVAHQQGKTDFLTFIRMCATFGIEKWAIGMGRMTCTYYDKAGNEMLVEEIPQ